jgi:hypothetical protein
MYSSTLSLISVPDGVDGHRHVPAALPPVKGPDAHFIGGWVNPRTGLEAV